jgi:hypothetical protein
MDEGFGTMFSHMLACIMAPAANSTINITLVDVTDATEACASATDATHETTVVRNALLQQCGNEGGLLDPEICNQLYRTILTTTPDIAFDYYATATVVPTIFFSIDLTFELTPLNKGSSLFNIRSSLADALGAPMDRILVQFRPHEVVTPHIASARRLLQFATVAFVWVYPQIGVNGREAWPVIANPGNVLASYDTNWRPAAVLKLETHFGDVVLSDACVDWPCPVVPLRPQLTDFSVVVVVEVGVIVNDYTGPDIVIIATAIKKQFALLLNLPETDVRILSETRFTTKQISRFSTEVRVSSEARGLTVKAQLKAAAGILAKSIKTAIGGNTDTSIRSVEINTKTLAAIVDSVVKEPVKKPGGGSAVVGIIILAVILVSGAIAVAWYYKRTHNKKTVDSDGTPKTTAATKSVLAEHSKTLFPANKHRNDGLHMAHSFYNRNYYGD